MAPGLSPLVDRTRAVLATEPSTREVPMFGGLSFMVNDKMVVAVGRDGHLLVRIDPDQSRELLAMPGAAPAVMGTGRVMGPSWLRVATEAVETDDDLSFWIGVALAYNARMAGDAQPA
jgi:TfoX/Sxy family transcriptional regulator of competence genes